MRGQQQYVSGLIHRYRLPAERLKRACVKKVSPQIAALHGKTGYRKKARNSATIASGAAAAARNEGMKVAS